MALRIQKRSWKNADGSTSESWRLIVETYTNGKRGWIYPARENYHRYGLDPDSPHKIALDALHAQRHRVKLARDLEMRARIEKRMAKQLGRESAFLPARLYQEFLEWLKERRMWDRIPRKTESHLLCMRNLILDIETDPADWPDKPERIYNWFRKKKLSLSYIEKILPLLNAYGYYYCRQTKRPYLPVPSPSGDVARRIEDANLAERDGDGGESLPLYPAQLELLRGWPPEQERWIRWSLYFGLRPSEVDALTLANQGKLWRVTKDSRGVSILHFYQSKLVRIARERRWKRIPALLPEQRKCLAEILKGAQVKRPIVKTLEKYLGDGHMLYAGRKGFEPLMRGHGQSDLNISRWLGHQDITRTERNYRELEAVDYTPVRQVRAVK